MEPKIFIAFRFHGNFYHSYRGDTPDELGFGKDIRIIRHIIQTLDELNQQGIHVCGTWDFENYFSLEKLIPEHCPDILDDLQRRVLEGLDEIQFMSYNNGLVSAHTGKEFEAAIQWSITNPNGSGLLDLFGDCFEYSVRPQEMMFTPIHLKLYPAYGIQTISLFYSAIPFNGFSNFIPKLSLEEQYNPLTLTYPGLEETMTLMPCYNIGDLIDRLTLRRWVKQLRKAQRENPSAKDLLLIVDMDADDQFWVGFDIPILKNTFSTIQGLAGLVNNLKDLPYIQFTTPGRYLKNHPPVGKISIGQDTADGSFDGYASWAEKWSNQRIWTGLERIRLLTYQTNHLINGKNSTVTDLLAKAFDCRVKLLSTTHFGMAAPLMNLTREGVARDMVKKGLDLASQAFYTILTKSTDGNFSLIDYKRGEATQHIDTCIFPSQALIRLPLRPGISQEIYLTNKDGQKIPCGVISNGEDKQLIFVESFQPEEEKRYLIQTKASQHVSVSPSLKNDNLRNEKLEVKFDNLGHLSLITNDDPLQKFQINFTNQITYAGKTKAVSYWKTIAFQNFGFAVHIQQRGELFINRHQTVIFDRELIFTTSLPYLYLRMVVQYPHTKSFGFGKEKAARLQQTWDDRWQEVMPCEMTPSFTGTNTDPVRVWKHNYFNHISKYNLNYGSFSSNQSLDSVNNHITHAWIAVSNGKQGVLVAQTADDNSNFAFCPQRTRINSDRCTVHLNPFGSYWGKQYNYATADTGLGKFLTTTMSASDHINPLAPSYNGKTQTFSLLVAPYHGDSPPKSVQNDAIAFAYPYLVINDDQYIADPPHRTWDPSGLG